MLNNRLGIFLYLLLPNRWSWSLLSDEEKGIIHAANDYHNTTRPDYANPDLYSGGSNFDSPEDRTATIRGRLLQAFLDREQPPAVLEIGPGSGFYTRSICYHTAVKHYVAIDINPAFLGWMKPRLERVTQAKPDFSFELFHGDFKTIDLPVCNAVVLISAVHHIPDRLALIQRLASLLPAGGSLFAVDPSHYIPRILKLLKNFCTQYHWPKFWRHHPNLSTHHFCTLEEYRWILNQVPLMSLESVYYFSFPRGTGKIRNWCLKNWYAANPDGLDVVSQSDTILRYLSAEIAAVMRKL
jgi:SAM-dependent methyltransferase